MTILLILLWLASILRAQEPSLLSKAIAVNLPDQLQAHFTQTRHSPLLEENLVSNGVVYLKAPDKIRWELISPVQKATVLSDDAAGRRFRLPTEKDFTFTTLSGEDLTLILTPVRRDMKQLFVQLVVKLDPESLLVRSVLMKNTDGGWTLLEFRDIRSDVKLDASLFE